MAITRARKEELLATYKQQLAESSGLVLADYTALTVPQMQDLRRKVREQQGQVFVVKNTLFSKALKDAGLEAPQGLLVGPTVAAFCHQDVPPVAKVFREFAKEVEAEKFTIKGSLLEGAFLSRQDTLAIADLPTRDELLSMVLRTINAPATQTVGVVASGIRQVLNVVKAYVDKLEEGGAPAEAAA